MCELSLEQANLKVYAVIVRARDKSNSIYATRLEIPAENRGAAFREGLSRAQNALGEITTISITTKYLRS